MFNNNLYNLMLQAVEEHKALWRITTSYMDDANEETKAYWNTLKEEKEVIILKLKELIKKELN